MPRGPRGEKRPADVIGMSVKVMRIATGEETEKVGTTKSAAELGSRGGISFLLTEEFPRNMGLIFNRCRRAHAGAGSLPLICPYADWRGRPCGAAVVVFASLPWSPAYSRSAGSSTASRLSAGGSVTAIGVAPTGLSSSLSGRCASAHLLKPFSWLVLSEIYMTRVLMLQKVEVTAGGPPAP